MNDDNSELNDIILNRNERGNSRKKMLVSIAALAIVLIVIVVIMGKLSRSHPAQLPQPVLPGGKQESPLSQTPESDTIDTRLADVAEKVKSAQKKPADESKTVKTPPQPAAKAHEPSEEIVIIDETTPAVTTVPAHNAPRPAAVEPNPVPKAHAKVADMAPPESVVTSDNIYIQVGSFQRYEPNNKFIAKIKRSGYRYRLYRVVVNGLIINKVLVGPFKSRSDAKSHLTDVRKKIEPGAFVYIIKP